MIVETLAVFFSAGVAEEEDTPLAPTLGVAGVPILDPLAVVPKQLDILARRSRTRVLFSDNGAGSIPRRVKRSDKEAKHRRAPSATCIDNSKVKFAITINISIFNFYRPYIYTNDS